jgi:hypothetical protein
MRQWWCRPWPLSSIPPKRDVNIVQISDNLKNLIDLNDDTYDHTNTEIDVVFAYLHATDNTDNGIGLFGNLLITAVSLIGSIEALPAAPFVAWILSGVVNSINESPPERLNAKCAAIKERYNLTSMEIDKRLAAILADIPGNLDKELKIPEGLNLPVPYNNRRTFKIRELADCVIPPRRTPEFEAFKDAHIMGFRYELTKQQLPQTDTTIAAIYQHSTLYYTLDKVISPGTENDRPHGCYPGGDMNYIDNWDVPEDNLMGNSRVRITCNSMNDFGPVAGEVSLHSGGLFVAKTGGDNSHVEYHKYYLVNGFSEDSDSSWRPIDKTLADWLFKDDGFGKIVNSGGVVKREELFRNWKIKNSDRLPKAL